MSIQDDLIKYQMMQQAAQQQQMQPQQPMPPPQQMPMQLPNGMPMQQQQRPVSPLESGAAQGWEAAKRSLEMNENENRRALGRALMAFNTGMQQQQLQPGAGISGALGRMNAGFQPALQAYDAERDRIASMNLMLQQQEKAEGLKERQEARAQRQESHQMEMDGRRTQILGDNYNLKSRVADDKINKELAQQAAFNEAGPGKIPLASFEGAERGKQLEYVDAQVLKGNSAAKTINTLNNILGLYKEDPHISNNIGTLMALAQTNDPTLTRQKVIELMPEEARARAETAIKYMSNLTVHAVQALGTTRANQFIERIISQSVPGIHMSGAAIERLATEMIKDASSVHQDSKDIYGAYANEKMILRKPPKEIYGFEEGAQPEAQQAAPAQSAATSGAIIQKLRERGMSDEQINSAIAQRQGRR